MLVSMTNREDPDQTASSDVCLGILAVNYSKTCLKQPLKNRQNKDLYDKW